LKNASSDGNISVSVVGFSSSSVDGRVDKSDDSSGHSASSISSVSGDAIVSQIVEDDSSSNDGVDSGQREEIEGLGHVDGSSNSLPVAHISVVSRSISGASVGSTRGIPMSSNGQSSRVDSGHISPPVDMDSVFGIRTSSDVVDNGSNGHILTSNLRKNDVSRNSATINLLELGSCVNLG